MAQPGEPEPSRGCEQQGQKDEVGGPPEEDRSGGRRHPRHPRQEPEHLAQVGVRAAELQPEEPAEPLRRAQLGHRDVDEGHPPPGRHGGERRVHVIGDDVIRPGAEEHAAEGEARARHEGSAAEPAFPRAEVVAEPPVERFQGMGAGRIDWRPHDAHQGVGLAGGHHQLEGLLGKPRIRVGDHDPVGLAPAERGVQLGCLAGDGEPDERKAGIALRSAPGRCPRCRPSRLRLRRRREAGRPDTAALRGSGACPRSTPPRSAPAR